MLFNNVLKWLWFQKDKMIQGEINVKNLSSKQFIPIVTGLLGTIFAYVGIFHLGFWDNKPLPGFFHTIISITMVLASIAAFTQTLSETDKPKYNKSELSVILGALSIIAGTFIIGLIPMVILYILYWLKVIEKAPWKDTLIIMAIVMAIVLGVFVSWLQIHFPWGLLETFM